MVIEVIPFMGTVQLSVICLHVKPYQEIVLNKRTDLSTSFKFQKGLLVWTTPGNP